ncbi:Uncharacterised protein [Chlamydia trachomatis]|nr:Uncharacterised protein [Chlamydia trachomatis]
MERASLSCDLHFIIIIIFFFFWKAAVTDTLGAAIFTDLFQGLKLV